MIGDSVDPVPLFDQFLWCLIYMQRSRIINGVVGKRREEERRTY